jgi:hypothetical protein
MIFCITVSSLKFTHRALSIILGIIYVIVAMKRCFLEVGIYLSNNTRN